MAPHDARRRADFRLEPASADASFRRYFRVFREDGTLHRDGRAARARGLRARSCEVAGPAARGRPERARDPGAGPRAGLPAAHRPGHDHLPRGARRGQRRPALRRCDHGARALAAASREGVLPPYDEALLRRELALFPDWYVGRHLGRRRSTPRSAKRSRRCSARILAREPRRAARLRAPRLHAAQPHGVRAQSRHPRFPGRGARPDQLRHRVALPRCLRELGGGARARRHDPLLGEGAAARGCRCAPTSPTSGATSSGWGCSATSRCSASSRASTIATASRATSRTRRASSATCATACARYRELAPLARLLDELEGRKRRRPATRSDAPRADPRGRPRRAHAPAHRHGAQAAARGRRQARSSPGRSSGWRAAGIRDIVVNHSHLGAQIEAALGDGSRASACASAIRARHTALETAGGIAQALPLLGDEPFVVVSGDIYTEFDYATLLARAEAIARDPGALRAPFRARRQSRRSTPAGDMGLARRPRRRAAGPMLTYAQHRRVPSRSLRATSRPARASTLFPWAYRFVEAGPRERRAFPRRVGQRRHARATRRTRQEAFAMTLYIPRHFRVDDPRDARGVRREHTRSARSSRRPRGPAR